MIYDSLSQCKFYYALNSRFEAAFNFLLENDLDKLSIGRYEIDSDLIFALVDVVDGKGMDCVMPEVHRKYVDIQYCVYGEDVIGWKSALECSFPEVSYDDKNDIMFFSDSVSSYINLAANEFAIFYPHDAHAPLLGNGKIKKIVVKVLL